MSKALKVLLPTNFSVQATYAQILLERLAQKVQFYLTTYNAELI